MHRNTFSPIIIVVVVLFLTIYILTTRLSTSSQQQIKEIPQPLLEKECAKDQEMLGFCSVEKCVNPFREYTRIRMMFYAPKYGLATCAMPKCLSTISVEIFCYLNVPNILTIRNKPLAYLGWSDPLCAFKNEGSIPDHKLLSADNWTHFAVVRHPVDRFLSAFVDKCVNADGKGNDPIEVKNWCLGCDKDMGCVLKKYYEKLVFHEDEPPIWRLEDHFYPQNWFCHFKTHMINYTIIKYPSDSKEMKSFLATLGDSFIQRGVPQQMVDTISDEMLNKRTRHATNGLTSTSAYRNALLGDKELLKLIVKIYYYDFVVFGFDFPEI